MSTGGCFGCFSVARPKDKFKVNSKGRQQGIKEGDRILSVNGQSTVNMTHAEAQRIIRESETGLELQLERIAEQIEAICLNGNGTMPSSVEVMSRLNAVDEDINHAGSWSTDSTSTGSTTIQVSSFHSDSSGSENVWSPSSKRANLRLNVNLQPSSRKSAPVEQAPPVPPQPPVGTPPPPADKTEDEASPVWKPFGAPYDGPQFRPVKLEVTRTQRTAVAIPQSEQPKTVEANATEVKPDPPNKPEATSNDSRTSEDAKENAPETGISPSTSAVFTKTGRSINLPPSQSPTITLLQKAREGQLPKGAVYIDDKPDLTPLPKNAVLIDQKVTVEGDKVHTDSYYAVPTLTTETSSYNVKAPPKYDGIGPTEYGIPVGLRTGVKEEYASDWYKTMYKSLHKQRFPNDSQKTVHLGGYMSEPEFERTDKYKEKYASDYRRMPEKSVSYSTQASSSDKSKIGYEPSVVRHEPKREAYRVEPRSIAEYEPGHSSLAEQEFHKFWSDFWDSMDDLHEHLGTSPKSQPSLNRRWPNVLLSDGYESDSTLIRKTGRSIEVDPDQQKSWYKEIQKGGEIPLTGLRKSVPEKPSEKSRSYVSPHIHGAEPPCSSHKHIPSTPRTPTLLSHPLNRHPSTSSLNSWSSRITNNNCPFSVNDSRAPIPPKRYSTSILISTLTSNHTMERRMPRNRSGSSPASESLDYDLSKRYSWPNGYRHSTSPICNGHSSPSYEYSKPANICVRHKTSVKGLADSSVYVPNGSRCGTFYVGSNRLPEYDIYHRPSNRASFLESCCHPGKEQRESNLSRTSRSNAFSPYIKEDVNLSRNHFNGIDLLVAQNCLENHRISESNNSDLCSSSEKFHAKSTLPYSCDCRNLSVPAFQSSIQNNKLSSIHTDSEHRDGNLCRGVFKPMPVINNKYNQSNNKMPRPTFKENDRASFRNALNFAKEMVSEMNASAQTHPAFPRMITILPPVVQVSSFNCELKPQVVHSEPQTNKKMSCTVDVKPLRTYLRKYGSTSPETTVQYDSSVEVLLKNFQKAKSDLNNVRSPWMINPRDELMKFAQVNDVKSNLIRLEKQVSNDFQNISTNFLRNARSDWKNNQIVLKNRNLNTNNNFHHHTSVSTSLINKNSNLPLNENNSIVYHEYVATTLKTASKSRRFTKLKNFYSSLEDIANSSRQDNQRNCYEINQIDVSWKKLSCVPKWDGSRDRSLRVRHSSVEDLRQIFQKLDDSQLGDSRTTFQMSFQYKRLVHCGSVSNLIRKYNRMDLKIQSGYPSSVNYSQKQNWNSPSFNIINAEFQTSISPFNYALPLWGDDICAHNYSEDAFNRHFIDTDQLTISTQCSSEENLHMPSSSKDVRQKVRFFEGIQPSGGSEFSGEREPFHKNLSCCDLSLEDQDVSSSYSSLFSPDYLPERAVSCMDLSCMSASEPLTHSWDRASSFTSINSSASAVRRSNGIFNHGIRTGTVSLLKSKLEKSLPPSPKKQSLIKESKLKSCSVPDHLAIIPSEKFRPGSTITSSRSRSGSVQNLVRKFEQDTFSGSGEAGYVQETSFNLKIGVVSCQPASIKKSCFSNINRLQNTDGVCWKALVRQSVQRRIRNMISRFEGFHTNDKLSCPTNHLTERFLNKRAPPVPKRSQIISESTNKKTFPPVYPNITKTIMKGNDKSLIPRVRNSSPRPFIKTTCRSSEELGTASQHQYQETQVNIHYKSPIRHLEKEYIEEDELRKRQEDAMRKLYEEERKKKHKQEMAEIEMRRHGDFFTPSQKSPIPLNRYDNPFDTGYSKVTTTTLYSRSLQGKTMAKALYPFVSQTTRELSLNKGDIVYINKQIDKNWYEGEHHGLVGIFPVSYVEIIPSEKANFQPRKPMEGEAIVKYNFRAQTPMELSLFKGEKVVLTGKKDHNWYEGRLGTKKGIFPISYVEVLQEPGEMLGLRVISPKPPASPVFGSLVNGSIPKPIEGPTFTTGLRPLQDKPPLNLEKIDSKSTLTQSLHIDTYNEPIPYKALYSYAPQNEDELELKEGDTVYVMEKCDDGWYVGTSLRTGLFGTFPGNYVERI